MRASVLSASFVFFVTSATMRMPRSGADSDGANSAECRYCANALSYALARKSTLALSSAIFASPLITPGVAAPPAPMAPPCA